MNNNVYDNVRIVRLLNNLAQSDIAEQLGISQATYGKLERGHTKMTWDRLEKIAKLLKTTTFELVNFDPANASMLMAKEPQSAPTPVSANPTTNSSEYQMLQERIGYLEKTNSLLEKQLLDKDEIISLLTKA